MSLYHSEFGRSFGGLKGRQMVRVVGDTWEEMLSVSREKPEISLLNRPRAQIDMFKSRSLPTLKVDSSELGQIESDRVSESHILVLTWVIRREIYCERFKTTVEVEKFFEIGIRGSMLHLLLHGDWIDEPGTIGLQNLNTKLEKIDLGRRSNLNYSKVQDLTSLKYDYDAKREDLTPISELHQSYELADPEKRAAMRSQKPWLATKWIEDFGS